ncbi:MULTISPECIES: protein phosphatase CheZ [Shewanella]|jgi:chemotaxis protein CheZ|uniref:Protein phosphatase CheZ n=1 Tax=Shewanella xiamenensis TaxID=332186 RepID=A0ABT6U9S0_9GAMM|nr:MULTISPECIES: protein phosphatase CheZ [Shewanella]PZP32735.1 MAG: protein phosphatase CheZ [Shewanella oneidensis]MBW0277970.1 protein phosphatase [Shewanella xiamenensis]MBW0294715.1 protein phosphatase [Shewanella xiamenensis]MCD8558255.1 protein phosphatase CheZ [Shewanella xiamenensis]MCT8864557.1 protein phosphatase CheZ [Shewanella xiamenensis]
MKSHTSGLITLEHAQRLVELLSANEQNQADDLLRELAAPLQRELFDEVGKLTRQLHSALMDFQIDNRLVELANTEIPDAKERLSYVIDMTEQAANKTMDAVEECLPLANALTANIQQVMPSWDKLMRREIALSDFKVLCHNVQHLMSRSELDSNRLRELLNQILMAQDFQDLTGQMIRRVIDLVMEVESNLVSMLTVFGEQPMIESQITQKNNIEAEGPIMNAELRQDVVTGQDEVDDLLSSLGF